jgi:hypothetical protein
MGVLQFILICVVVGFVVWAVTKFVPMPGPIRNLIVWAAVIVLVLIFLSALGLLGRDFAIPLVK